MQLNPIPPLPMLAASTINNPAYFIADISREVMIGYCPENQVGAVYHGEGKIWSVMGPLSFEAFSIALRARGLSLPDDSVTADWVNAVSSRCSDLH